MLQPDAHSRAVEALRKHLLKEERMLQRLAESRARDPYADSSRYRPMSLAWQGRLIELQALAANCAQEGKP